MPPDTPADPFPPAVRPLTYTAAEVADLLRCSVKHVHKLNHSGELPGAVKCGRLVRFAKVAVDRWPAEGVAHAG